ncbi:MAG: tetratricopeptide repeat protein [Bacteroidia bacterium]|nr:tetratricopeptide repeat protein [Bacteroidia bacterium]
MRGVLLISYAVILHAQHGMSSFAPPKDIGVKVQGELRGVEENRDLARARALALEGKYAQALSILERNKAQNQDNPSFWYWIGYCQENLDQKDAAIQAYSQALQKNPGMAQAWWGKGSVLFKEKRYEEAYQAFEQVTHHAPKEPQAYFYAGVSLWMQNKRLQAIPWWEKAVKLGLADSANVFVWIGDTYAEVDSLALAEQAYKRATKAPKPPAEALAGLGKVRLAQRDPEGAIPLLAQAEAQLPQDPSPPYYKGMAYKQLGKTAEAQSAFQEALRRKPDHARSLYEMGLIALEQNRIDDAQKYYEQLKTVNSRLAQQLLQEILNKR